MRQSITLIFFCTFVLQISCSSSKRPTASIVRDGSSFKHAIVVESISEEYEWVRTQYPEGNFEMQALVFKGRKPFDVLTFRMPDGTRREIYFDIAKFYGKGF